MKNLSIIALLLAAVLVPTSVQAGHDSPLTNAARAYRDAVVDFERNVIRARYIDRYDVRLVDDLEDATSELRSASRDPFRGNRFAHAWQDVSDLHRRVEASLFGRGNYRIDPQLARCWATVVCAYTDLIAQVNYLDNHAYGGVHGGTVYRERAIVPTPRVPEVVLPQVITPNVTIPEIYIPPTPSAPTIPAPPITVPTPEVRYRATPEVYVPAPISVPRPVVQPTTYGRSVHIERSRSRTIARPTIGVSRGVQIERHHNYGATPSYYPGGNQNVGTAIVGALLTRILN